MKSINIQIHKDVDFAVFRQLVYVELSSKLWSQCRTHLRFKIERIINHQIKKHFKQTLIEKIYYETNS